MDRPFSIVRQLQLAKGKYKWVGKVALGITGCLPAYLAYEWISTQQKVKQYRAYVGDKVFMDVGIGNRYAGRILIGLYSEKVPLTCENFLQLCKGYRIKDKMIGYRNTQFHLIRPGSCIVGGDVILGTGKSHGLSIYGEAFPDENFDMEFLRDGDLAMINWGKNTNSSQFMITLSSQRVYYGHHVVFGTVLKGMRVVREMGELGTRVGRPAMPIRVLQCGVYEEDGELPGPPTDFLPPVGPLMSEDDFRAAQEEKRGTKQPS
uniref:Peptidyl-prolyl cis-trans isomerase n=1 Tax=Alexandrium monilatum TaxID=311494 RepID=A0A7S4VTT6_9DINO